MEQHQGAKVASNRLEKSRVADNVCTQNAAEASLTMKSEKSRQRSVGVVGATERVHQAGEQSERNHELGLER